MNLGQRVRLAYWRRFRSSALLLSRQFSHSLMSRMTPVIAIEMVDDGSASGPVASTRGGDASQQQEVVSSGNHIVCGDIVLGHRRRKGEICKIK